MASGTITNIKILRSSRDTLGKHAIDVVKNMPVLTRKGQYHYLL
jgi:hypothetical protein